RFDRIKLYQNQGDLIFEEIGQQVGLRNESEIAHWGACWADYDKDGWLDLYVCKVTAAGDIETEYELNNNLYHSNGDGTFTDVTLQLGVGDSLGISYQSNFFDYNNDGWLDLFVINDKWFENTLFKNNGDGTFSDVSEETNMDVVMDAMCIAADDYDNDFDTDMYVSNTWIAGNGEGNLLFKNTDGVFEPLPEEVGLGVYETCWGSQWVDYDNNGLQDLWNTANFGLNFTLNPFFINEGNDLFTQANDAVGLGGNQDVGYGVAMGDIDNDGFPDVIQNNAHPHQSDVYKNSGGDNNWLKVGVQGTISNREAIGSLIYVYSGNLRQQRLTHCGEGYLSQNSDKEFFGLGDREVIDSLVITWPNGLIERWTDLDVNQTITFIEGSTFTASIVADELSICEGQSTTLGASVEAEQYWGNGVEGSSEFNADAPGWYSLEVLLENGISVQTDSIEVTLFELQNTTAEVTNPFCAGDSNGVAEVSHPLGEGSISWTDDDTAGFIREGLSEGTYYYIYTDINGCSQQDSITVSDGIVLEGELTLVNEVIDESLGTASIVISNGTPPFSYNWSTGCFNFVCSNLEAGNYTLEVTDSNGCIANYEFEIQAVVSIEEAQLDGLEIFPVPMEQELNIVSDSPINSVQILDLSGKLVKEFTQLEGNTINVEDISSGVYILKVLTQKGQHSVRISKD
ncbi:MAG: VCBS repeat-containing protein, partial [Flavobacteriales bacterium]|nr:VCBS repeat-containing protein [Flavobacteriales bacterium]